MPSSKITDYKKLGYLNAEIWAAHDARDFRKVARLASELLQALGFPKGRSVRAGRIISECYELADEAEKNPFLYSKIRGKFEVVEKTLGYEKSVAHFQARWWQGFRERKNLGVFYNIFRQHYRAFGPSNLGKAVTATTYLMRAGLKHKTRDLDAQAEELAGYWEASSKLPRDRLAFVG